MNHFASGYFTEIPADWIADVLRSRDESIGLPMWDTLFLVDDPQVAKRIGQHCSKDNFDDDPERQRFIDSGWHVVTTTGIYARWLDDRLLLGIDGAGYDFVAAHWEPLYHLLGFGWHLDD